MQTTVASRSVNLRATNSRSRHVCQAEAPTRIPSAAPSLSSRRLALVGLSAGLSLLGGAASISHAEPATVAPNDPQLDAITDKVYLEFGVCPEAVRSDRNLGDKSIFCSEPESLGRVVIGLYGNAAPGTVKNFKTLITTGALAGTALSKIIPGQWLVAGSQGSKRFGLLQPPEGIEKNPDVLSSSAFKLKHLRPGTLSLNLSENEDDDSIRFSGSYRPLSFLITTGPAPAQSLDGENIVFGSVLEGLDVISAITRVPTFQPYGQGRQFNAIAKFIGDERATKTSAKWGKPLKAVLITNTGVV